MNMLQRRLMQRDKNLSTSVAVAKQHYMIALSLSRPNPGLID